MTYPDLNTIIYPSTIYKLCKIGIAEIFQESGAGKDLSRCLGIFSMSWTGGHCSHTKTTVFPTNLYILAQDSQTYHIN